MNQGTPSHATAREIAEKLAGGHNYCEDCWYSCPLAPEGCCDDRVPKDKCNCGYDERVDVIAAALEAQREADAKKCLEERVDAEATNDEGDYAYNRACEDCANAILEK